jgi:hypothetical protein
MIPQMPIELGRGPWNATLTRCPARANSCYQWPWSAHFALGSKDPTVVCIVPVTDVLEEEKGEEQDLLISPWGT